MKFVGQVFQKLDHKHYRQTDTHTQTDVTERSTTPHSPDDKNYRHTGCRQWYSVIAHSDQAEQTDFTEAGLFTRYTKQATCSVYCV